MIALKEIRLLICLYKFNGCNINYLELLIYLFTLNYILWNMVNGLLAVIKMK